MMDAPEEYLIILRSNLANQVLEQVRAVATVTQTLPPRLVLIRAEAGVQARLAGIAGVAGVYNETPPDLPPDLTRTESLFISGWESRQRRKPRPGEDLAWDAPGFVAPDAPPDTPFGSSGTE